MSPHQFWNSAQQMATPEFVLSGVCRMKHAEKPARGKSNIKALVELSGSSPGFLSVTYRPVSLAKAEASPTSLPVCQGDNWRNYPSCSKKPRFPLGVNLHFLCPFLPFLWEAATCALAPGG